MDQYASPFISEGLGFIAMTRSTERLTAPRCWSSRVPRSASAPTAGFTASVPGQEPLGFWWPMAQPTRSARKRSAPGPERGKRGPTAPSIGSAMEAVRSSGAGPSDGRRKESSTIFCPSPRAPSMARPRAASWLPSNQSQPGARLERPRGLPATATTRSPRSRPAAAAGPPLRTSIRLNAVCWCSVRAVKPSMPQPIWSGPKGPLALPRMARLGASWKRMTRAARTASFRPRFSNSRSSSRAAPSGSGTRARTRPASAAALTRPATGAVPDSFAGASFAGSSSMALQSIADHSVEASFQRTQTSASALALRRSASTTRNQPLAASFFFPSESGRAGTATLRPAKVRLPTVRISSPRTSARRTVLLPVSSAGAFSARRSARLGAARVRSARGKGRSQRMARAYWGPAGLSRP